MKNEKFELYAAERAFRRAETVAVVVIWWPGRPDCSWRERYAPPDLDLRSMLKYRVCILTAYEWMLPTRLLQKLKFFESIEMIKVGFHTRGRWKKSMIDNFGLNMLDILDSTLDSQIFVPQSNWSSPTDGNESAKLCLHSLECWLEIMSPTDRNFSFLPHAQKCMFYWGSQPKMKPLRPIAQPHEINN